MRSRASQAARICWPLVLATVVVGPMLTGRGFALVGDMVFVPEQPWKPAWLGLDGSVPRAVPGDALVSFTTQVVPGDLLQKAVLVLTLAAAGWGAVRITQGFSTWARLAACSLYVWNPFVYERLAIGHWALLCGYAALPWAVHAATRVRDGSLRDVGRLVVPVSVAAWTSPTGGVLATAVVVVVLLGRRGATSVPGLLVCLGLNLPWLVPGVLATADQLAADVLGVSAFAARADTPYGALGSLLSLGGMWKTSVDPPARDSAVLAGLALAVAVVALGLVVRRALQGDRLAGSLGVLAALGLALAWLPATEHGAAVVEWLVTTVPGAGLLRDSQKWVALTALPLCWGTAALVDAVASRRWAPRAGVGVAAVLLPVIVLPALAWGLLGTLRPVAYPDDWQAVRTLVEQEPAARTVVLPFSAYRRFEWNLYRAVLDPAPRWLPGEVVTNDVLTVDTVDVGGESRRAQRIADALADPDELAEVLEEESVRWVLVEKGTPTEGGPTTVPGGHIVHDGADLMLVDLGPRSLPPGPGHAPYVLAVDLVVLFGAGLLVSYDVRRRIRCYAAADDPVGGN